MFGSLLFLLMIAVRKSNHFYPHLTPQDVWTHGQSKAQIVASADALWQGKVEVQREESKPKNDFLVDLQRQEEAARGKTTSRDEDKDVCEGNDRIHDV